MPDSPSPSDRGTPFTCTDIARKLGYATSSIWRALRRLGIQPDETTSGGLKLYYQPTVTALQAKLSPPRPKA